MKKYSTTPQAFDGDRNKINIQECVVPVIKQLDKNRFAIIGTGFYISRYGLFVTASHVVSDLTGISENCICPSFILHQLPDHRINFRRIRWVSSHPKVDIAVGQAENYIDEDSGTALMNKRGILSNIVPCIGGRVTTFGYPENEIMDFGDPDNIPIIECDYYEGKFLREVKDSNHPEIRYRHFETSILLKSGTSGGPIFYRKKIVGINCRGWDFGNDDDSLSYIVPLEKILEIHATPLYVPSFSWEFSKMPSSTTNKTLTVRQLVKYGHIDYVT